MKRLNFIRHFVGPTGGNIALRSFFTCARQHSGLQVRIAFTPETRDAGARFWGSELDSVELPFSHAFDADIVAVNGKDWRLMRSSYSGSVIHFVQHLGYAQDATLLEYLARPAFRVCVSEEVRTSIEHFANGPSWVVPNSIDPALFHPSTTRPAGSILIGGVKDVELGRRISAAFPNATLITEWMPRCAFADLMRAHDIFVALPRANEGFFLPALEAMACGCAVVCADAVGNRGHCIPHRTCLQPKWGDAADHLLAIRRLLDEPALRDEIRSHGRSHAAQYSPALQRQRFHAVLDAVLEACLAK